MCAQVRFISDLHLEHSNMSERRGFNNLWEHREAIIDGWNSVVNKKDVTYLLGDVTMEKKEGYDILSRLNGTINVVLGNHDRRQDVRELLRHVNTVAGMIKYRKKGMNIFLTHCPVHPRELDYRITHNIHGHLHEYNVTLPDGKLDKRYINVCCDHKNINYVPKTLEELFKL